MPKHVAGFYAVKFVLDKLYTVCIKINRYISPLNWFSIIILKGHPVAQWLRHCATNRKVVRSIPDGVVGIFH
jgi:hypothetical protein